MSLWQKSRQSENAGETACATFGLQRLAAPGGAGIQPGIQPVPTSATGCYTSGSVCLFRRTALRGVSFEDQTAVGAAEAERVRQRVLDVGVPRLVRHVVEIAVRIRVDRG